MYISTDICISISILFRLTNGLLSHFLYAPLFWEHMGIPMERVPRNQEEFHGNPQFTYPRASRGWKSWKRERKERRPLVQRVTNLTSMSSAASDTQGTVYKMKNRKIKEYPKERITNVTESVTSGSRTLDNVCTCQMEMYRKPNLYDNNNKVKTRSLPGTFCSTKGTPKSSHCNI